MKLSLTGHNNILVSYDGEFKETNIIKGQILKFFYPKKHSTVESIYFEIINNNAWDDYANITDYRVYLYIIYKNKKVPVIKFHDNKESVSEYRHKTFNDVLFDLEKNEIKEKKLNSIRKKILKNEIKYLKKKLSSCEKELCKL